MASKRALVVDDNPDVRSGLQEALSLWGYEIDLAEDATQASEALLRARPEVIVMDGNALEIIQRVKAENGRVFVVVFSGWAHLEGSARAAGADAFVLKPDFDGLARILASRAS